MLRDTSISTGTTVCVASSRLVRATGRINRTTTSISVTNRTPLRMARRRVVTRARQ